MVELSEYLLDLVFRQKSATIPELGTFRFVTTSAKLNFGEHIMSPPSQALTFTESTFDQGDLSFVEFLVKEKGFDPYEANIRIKAYVHQIRSNFKQLGYSYIPGFGTLHMLENEAIKFVAGDKIKAIKPTLGLPELNIKPIAREFVKSNELETEVETNSFIDNRSEKVSSEKNKWAKPALVGFVMLGIGLILFYLYTSNYTIEDTHEKIVAAPINEDSLLAAQNGFFDSTIVEVLDSVADKAAMIKEIDNVPPIPAVAEPNQNLPVKKKIVEEKVKEVPKSKETVATNEVIKTSGKQCAIIVGAMGNPDNAKKLAKQVKNKGFTPFTLETKKLTKVGASCNCDVESIQSTLAAMKKINSAAWVYESE